MKEYRFADGYSEHGAGMAFSVLAETEDDAVRIVNDAWWEERHSVEVDMEGTPFIDLEFFPPVDFTKEDILLSYRLMEEDRLFMKRLISDDASCEPDGWWETYAREMIARRNMPV